jgi:hypothetical protein
VNQVTTNIENTLNNSINRKMTHTNNTIIVKPSKFTIQIMISNQHSTSIIMAISNMDEANRSSTNTFTVMNKVFSIRAITTTPIIIMARENR